MIPPTFHGTKVDDVPQGYLNEPFKVVDTNCVTPREKVELDAYQLKDVVQMWIEQWRDKTPIREVLIEGELYTVAFIDKFFPYRVEG